MGTRQAGTRDRREAVEQEATQRPPCRLEARFGPQVLAAGYTVTPNLLLRYAAQLEISAGELLLVQYIWQHWWDEQRPHSSVALLARQMGKSPRMVRYYLESLRGKGLVELEERHGRAGERLSNGVDFQPLIKAVVELSRADDACSWLQRIKDPPLQRSTQQRVSIDRLGCSGRISNRARTCPPCRAPSQAGQCRTHPHR